MDKTPGNESPDAPSGENAVSASAIEEAALDGAEEQTGENGDADNLVFAADPRREDNEANAPAIDPERVWQAARILAMAILAVWLIAWPVGTTLAHLENTGVLRLSLGYSGSVVILALMNSMCVLVGGYMFRTALRLEATADRLRRAVRSFEPSLRSGALREDVTLLGGELDRALSKLADAEQQIRQQVGAIEAATETMSVGSGAATERLAEERRRLIEATAAMNAEAEAFAAALAASSAQSPEALSPADPQISVKVERLEKLSAASAEQFEALRDAMAESIALFRDRPAEIADELQTSRDSLKEAQEALISESQKLRELIDQQRDRADRLGKSLAEKTTQLEGRKRGPSSLGNSWRRILDTVERQVTAPKQSLPAKSKPPEPEDLSPEDIARIERLYRFTKAMKIEVIDAPEPSEEERFASGERHLFALQLLGHDRAELEARLAKSANADTAFARDAEQFLDDFDQVLAPAMQNGPEESEDALQEMLRSPLGQIYVLVGTAKGHFS